MAIAGVNGMNSMWLNRIRQQMMAAQLPGAINQLTSAIQSLQSLLSSFQAGGVGGQPGLGGGAGLGGGTMPGLQDLISKYTGMGLGGPQSLQNIEKLLGEIVGQLSTQNLGGGAGAGGAGGSVTPPSYGQRPMGPEMGQLLQIVQQLLQQNPQLGGALGGALGGGNGGIIPQNYLPVGGGAGAGTGALGNLAGTASGTVANTAGLLGGGNDISTIGNQMLAASNSNYQQQLQQIANSGLDSNTQNMLNLQAQMAHQQEVSQLMSTLLKDLHEMKKGIIQNMTV